jgi:hypothetical protein
VLHCVLQVVGREWELGTMPTAHTVHALSTACVLSAHCGVCAVWSDTGTFQGTRVDHFSASVINRHERPYLYPRQPEGFVVSPAMPFRCVYAGEYRMRRVLTQGC